MEMTDELIKIKDAIVTAVPAEKIYLFGSHANGQPNEDSDYDIYEVIPNIGIRPIEAIQSIYRSMRGKRTTPMDVLAGTVDTFERRSKQVTLERKIADEGVLLYAKT